MSKHDPKLLAWLAERYYVEEPSADSRMGSWHDEGIRHHEGGGPALAGWYRGPFFWLLRADFASALVLIDRMLDRGARVRLETLAGLQRQLGDDPNEALQGLEFTFAEVRPRLFVGDQHAWSWYRGSSVGPYPCMSALFALEMFMDGCVRSDIAVATVVHRIMRNASTLASVGLCFGFLVRHIDKVSTELDDILAEPSVWELEFSRVVNEGRLHVQGSDGPTVPGRERRAWTPLNVAMYLVVSALQNRDETRLTELRNIGVRLIEKAGGHNASPTIRRWAAHLDSNNYKVIQEGGDLLIRADVPEEVTEALAPVTEELAQTQEVYRLLNRYHVRYATPYRFALPELPIDEELSKDVQAAQRLGIPTLNELSDPRPGAVAGVAAAVLHRANNDASEVEPAMLDWAREVLVRFALDLQPAAFNNPEAMYSLGGDRQAALALPLIIIGHAKRDGATQRDPLIERSQSGIGLLKRMRDWLLARVRASRSLLGRVIKPARVGRQDKVAGPEKWIALVLTALEACTCSPSVEVRHCVAEGLRTLFDQSCSTNVGGRCWHEGVWQAIEAGARRVVLGDFDESGRAEVRPITGALVSSLADAPDDRLMLTYIEPAAICAMDAARTAACIQPKAVPLRDALLQAYARSASSWAERHYHRRNEQTAAFASAVLRTDTAAEPEFIINIAVMLADSSGALADYLDALVMASTYEIGFVQQLSKAWPRLMEIGLRPFRDPRRDNQRYPTTRRLDSLMPSPRTSAYFEDPKPVLDNATARWLPTAAISEHVEEWLRYGHGEMQAVDALLGFLKTRPLSEQVQPGLEWVHKIVIDDDRTASTCGFLLVSWLHTIRSAISGEAPKRWYREILDALVLGRYAGARELQALDE